MRGVVSVKVDAGAEVMDAFTFLTWSVSVLGVVLLF
jgi:hypothetical protein